MAFISLETLLKEYKPAYPENGTWNDTIKGILDSPYDNEIVTLLMEDLQMSEYFREPIALTPDEDVDEYGSFVCNGTHRVVAHILSGSKTVFVQYGFPDIDEEESIETTEILIGFSKKDLEERYSHDDALFELFDIIFTISRSLKISDTLWIESNFMSENSDSFYISYPRLSPEVTFDVIRKIYDTLAKETDLSFSISSKNEVLDF